MTRITNRTVAALAVAASFNTHQSAAEVLLQERFLYASGPLVGAMGSPWTNHSGAESEIQTDGDAIRLSRSQSEDVNVPIPNGEIDPEDASILYIGLDIEMSAPPSPNGSYFAHLNIGGHRARVFLFGANDDMAYHLALSNASSDAEERVAWPNALQLGTPYRIVLAYDVATASSRLWIDPASITSASIEAPDPADPTSIRAFALRQAPGIGEIYCDNLILANTFLEASNPGPNIINPTIEIEPPTLQESNFEPARVHLRGLDSQLLPTSPILRFTGSVSLTTDIRIDIENGSEDSTQLSPISQSEMETRARIDGLGGRPELTLILSPINDTISEPTKSLSIEMERLNLGPTSASILILRDDDRAHVILDEPFEYGSLPIIDTEAGWESHSGSVPGEIRAGSGKLILRRSQSEDVSWAFPDGAATADIYAHLSVIFVEAPSASGAYFAHWNTSRHHGRLFAFSPNDEETVYLGIANGVSSAAEATIWETPLQLGSPIELFIRYDHDTQQSTLWVNADPNTDPGIVATDAPIGSAPSHFSFRQASGIGEIHIDSLRILSALDESDSEEPPLEVAPTLSLLQRPKSLELRLTGTGATTIETSSNLREWSELHSVQALELPWAHSYPLSTFEPPVYFRTRRVDDE